MTGAAGVLVVPVGIPIPFGADIQLPPVTCIVLPSELWWLILSMLELTEHFGAELPQERFAAQGLIGGTSRTRFVECWRTFLRPSRRTASRKFLSFLLGPVVGRRVEVPSASESEANLAAAFPFVGCFKRIRQSRRSEGHHRCSGQGRRYHRLHGR
jgi:hypothetical protein